MEDSQLQKYLTRRRGKYIDKLTVYSCKPLFFLEKVGLKSYSFLEHIVKELR